MDGRPGKGGKLGKVPLEKKRPKKIENHNVRLCQLFVSRLPAKLFSPTSLECHPFFNTNVLKTRKCHVRRKVNYPTVSPLF